MLHFFSVRYHPESEKRGKRRTEIPKNLIRMEVYVIASICSLPLFFTPDTHAESLAVILWLISVGF